MRGQRKNPRKAVQPFENKKRKIDIFKNYEANGVEKIQRKLEIFSTLISKKSIQKLEHCDVLEIKTLEPYNAYNAREDRKKKKLPLISPLDIDLDSFQKIVLIFPVWGYTPALPMQSFMREHSLNNEVEIISVGVARLGGMYEDIHKLLPQAKITRFTHISRASDLTDKELETMLRYRSLPPSMHAKLTKGLDAYQEEIKALIDFTNAEFAKMLPRTATWCKTPKVKPNPRASTNPAPGCLSFQNNILYFNGQPVGKGVFYDVLPSEGNKVTISGSDERILKSH